MASEPLVSVIFVNYNTRDMLQQSLGSIDAWTKGVTHEVIVVDNASRDGSREMLKLRFPAVRLLENSHNLGFGAGNNMGARQAAGRYLLFLNTDTLLVEDALTPLASYLAEHPEAGAVGPKLLHGDRTYQISSGALPSIGVEARSTVIYALAARWRRLAAKLLQPRRADPRETGWVTGACLMVDAKLFASLGGFDEHMFMYFEDKDLCRRILRTGRKVIFHPGAEVVHLLGGSSRSELQDLVHRRYRDSQRYYYQKHLGKVQNILLRFYLRMRGTT